ncbi:MAG TPA: hypothetical protein VEW71_03340 [Allosphingosinicella sp.]|nr:hypothetical protein [Allosphingosinicella sp.]
MRKRRESRADEALEGLSYWFQDYWKVVLLLLGLAAFLGAAGLWWIRNNAQPALVEDAQVIRFGAYSFDDGRQPVVLVRTNDGRTRQLAVPRGSTHLCRVGSTIRLIRRGAILTVDPRGCRPGAP